ncbi:outer dense fiber protein 2 [Lingula anatina]|uniref:Outer dense fiber protein 2 n=1 Tax=Lingula anatina TaxID=7574 RepID=A0A1S3KCU7_LINAN|nr:outer dense fiber protein 2 [Lingula anatina]|eukprot:XP_013420317.1 outer dense fiber protein 2 [Lingula anatina]
MTIERDGLHTTSPVHVHVEDETPVHVHVKKPKKSASARAVDERLAESRSKTFSSGNLRHSTASSRARSKSPLMGPWVPPPGRTSRSSLKSLAWQGPSHRLEITTPRGDDDVVHGTMRMSDLDTDEEERVHANMRGYEKKIDSLMTEVGTLQNEVELQKTLRDMEKKDDLLETSRRVMADQETELRGYKRELNASETENRILKKSMDRLKEEVDFNKSEREVLNTEKDMLMKKLVEVEMDGQAAAKQMSELRDMVRRLREEKRISSSDSAALAKQKEQLMEKLTDFESTNRTLRRLLREKHKDESENMRVAEQRDILLKKLGESDAINQQLRVDLLEKDRQIGVIRGQLDNQKEENLAISGMQSSLEQTRAHLQKQLRVKESDCNRMAVQIRGLESQLAQEKIEVDHLQELLQTAKEKAERDKEALKKATRVQKQRAARSEDTVQQINSQLLEKEAQAADLEAQLENIRSRVEKLSKEKSQVMGENSALKTRISELESQIEQMEENQRVQMDSATAQLHTKTSEVSSLKLDNERLRANMCTIESKLSQTEEEVAALRTNIKQYEVMTEDYRAQANKSQREKDEMSFRLDEQEKETRRVQKGGEMELERVKMRLQQRLEELEPLPELLKTTELKLQDAQERLLVYERKNTDNTKLIAELTVKVEHQTEHVESFKDRLHAAEDDNRALRGKVDTLERRLQDADDHSRELASTVAKRDESIHQANQKLEEKIRENGSLTRQLETALTDSRRQMEQAREKATTKERNMQSRLLELESQLSQARAEIAKLKREKDEMERKFNSRLYDLKDRLEQSHSTNRSMQNYVQFLKNSYANVFGDTTVGAGESPMRSTLH